MPRPLPRSFYDRPALDVARDLLGTVIVRGEVQVRLSEVEAYDGANDPASHAYRGPTARNAVMFGPPGHAYVYFTYGMHFCVNVVCGPMGIASAVLLRAGEVIAGQEIAMSRRPRSTVRDLARGPARLTQALAIDRGQDGADVTGAASGMWLLGGAEVNAELVRRGPRVGVCQAADRDWRFWIDGDRTVSAYRRHLPKRRNQ
ncbi:MAG TPA: DNA-3-methyladenine glycosylase [Mycobacteriales bacterium]|nr:DNA-3-methyladenine glycosylase [Mycobacteriales bacterium]